MAIDYRSFSTNGEGGNQVSKDKRWWLLDSADKPSAISGIIGFLQQHQSGRQTQIITSARLYGNLSVMGLNGLSFSRVASSQAALPTKITYNVCQAATDTITSKIAKNKPRPLFLSSGGDWKIKRKSKKLTKFVDGVFYENRAYELGTTTFRDGTVWGSGCTHVFKHNKRVKYERVLLSELYVDEVEGFYGEPRQIHRVKNVDRQVLIEEYSGHKAKILACNPASKEHLGGYENISDVITVRESWHLRSGPESSDGRHTITIDNDTLLDEPYNRDKFPFAFFHWNKRLFGFWGQGGVEQIQNIQLEINKLLWVIQRSFHLAGSFKILCPIGSKVVKEHFNNDLGTLLNYAGEVPPQYITPPIIPPEIYNHLVTLKASAFEQFGISQLSAMSKKPDGLDSGKALREYNDIESDRFMTVGRAYEQYYLDLADLSIEAAKEIAAEEKGYKVKVPGKRFFETIDWKDIDLKADQYVMKVFPVSSLPTDPAGRLATIQEYAQAGYLTPRAARRLLDFPDLEQEESLANAQEEYLHDVLEQIVEEGKYTAPEPEDDLALAKELALQYYAQGKNDGLEQSKLDKLLQFSNAVTLIVTKATTPAVPPAPPLGAPGPTADLGPAVAPLTPVAA